MAAEERIVAAMLTMLTSVRAWLLANAPWPTKAGKLAELPLVEIDTAIDALARGGDPVDG